MWNDQSAIGGGFFNSSSQFGNANTPNQPQKSEGRRASRTAPIVIKQALHSGLDGIKIWGTEIQVISVVARVRNIKIQSSKMIYTIQDITGRMKAVMWLDQEAVDEDEKSIPKVQVNDYVQIYGNVKTNMGKKVVMVYKIIPLTDVNAITFHYLQCIKNKVKMEADSKKEKVQQNNPAFNSGLPANSMVGKIENVSEKFNPRQKMVINLIRASIQEQGISKQDMYASLKDRMSEMELKNILQWMAIEGHVYTSIDDDHFIATELFDTN